MALVKLRLTMTHRAAMLAHVRKAWPNEACGLLGGPPGQVAQVYCVENAYHSPVAYYMDPVGQVRAMLDIEAAGWEIVGIFHSHPTGPTGPSATDVAQAYYPEAVYVILAPDGADAWSMRGFEIVEGMAREVMLEVAEQL